MKIRLDFVTNSSSTSYTVVIQKLKSDKEILKELEKLSGFGPKGATAILYRFEKMDKLDLQSITCFDIEIRENEEYYQAEIYTQDDDYSDNNRLLNIGNRLCDEVFEGDELERKAKTFKVVHKGERH